MDIQIYRDETYPERLKDLQLKLRVLPVEIIDYLQNENCVYDYLKGIREKDGIKTSKELLDLIDEIVDALLPHNIVVYQNTRLVSPRVILEQGVKPPQKDYLNYLKREMKKANVDSTLINEVVRLIITKSTSDSYRKETVNYYYDREATYDENLLKFFSCFGGELMARATGFMRDLGECPENFRHVVKLGRPFIIEFKIPFTWYDDWDSKEALARYILEDWIYTFVKREQNDRRRIGTIYRSIPPEYVIDVHLADANKLTPLEI